MKFNLFRFPYSRIVYGVILFILGCAFALLPMIPLGYIFLFASFFLLAKKVPIFNKAIEYFKERDKKGRLRKVEKKINHFFGEDR
ncbi:hypothetical protein [Acidiluteibacter ferrifornacis]|jgi:uncharacterized membrane protein YbaN (DUF454 family)|uniref:Transmembrane protein (PGPGW) n=1 Tax=Acidiluteibacter ferrifornacis TaxID=2692424 RepID=A0A6N9NHQ0_9FLAO|nr:hypothetical protein [Acidiluteibacter ferrifornacis]MBR9832878.1 hypothetical protein [bacterium]NBG65433.1 hypothetical protein [Acidiluteibacter ferrifornacis]|tara:strand:+ start:13 stop:267 length:255 start_codon:yes stop_codon:yes gene_type:complete